MRSPFLPLGLASTLGVAFGIGLIGMLIAEGYKQAMLLRLQFVGITPGDNALQSLVTVFAKL